MEKVHIATQTVIKRMHHEVQGSPLNRIASCESHGPEVVEINYTTDSSKNL